MYTYTHIYGVYVGFTFVKIHCGGFFGGGHFLLFFNWRIIALQGCVGFSPVCMYAYCVQFFQPHELQPTMDRD